MRKGDRILIVVLVLALAAGAAWLLFGRSDTPGMVVVCQTDEGFYRADSLSDDVEYTVETENEGKNVVRIQDGQVEVTSANCKNQICVEHAPISAAGEQIVCLPHGLIVEVAESEDDVAPLQ